MTGMLVAPDSDRLADVREMLVPGRGFATVRQALADLAAGRAVVVVDDEGRENEGDIIFAADLATPELMAFMVRHSSGFVCVAVTGDDCERMGLTPMIGNGDAWGTAYQVTVDAADGVTTGISARDRAHTAQLLTDPTSSEATFTRPGHVVPLRARPHGVLERRGHTEAAVDLCRLAGRRPAGVLCEIVSAEQPTTMARRPELERFAAEHGLTLVTIAELVAFRERFDHRPERVVQTSLPTPHGLFTVLGYRAGEDEHLAMVFGDAAQVEQLRGDAGVLVRVHPECVLGDALRSGGCECAEALQRSLAMIAAEGAGVLLYVRAAGHADGGVLRHLVNGAGGAPEGPTRLSRRDRGIALGMLADLGIGSVLVLGDSGRTASGPARPLTAVDRSPLTAAPARHVDPYSQRSVS